MNTSHRFAVGVHILALLALSAEPLSSSYIAGSVNTNPAMIRRILGLLAKSGMTHSAMGANGGTRLAKAATDISLLDVYRAVEEPGILALHANDPNPDCAVGKGITVVLESVIERAEVAMESVIAGISIQDVIESLKSKT
jgi:Rrf2 family protein